MRLTIHEDPSLTDDSVTVKYRKLTPAIRQIIEICNQNKPVLLGEIDRKKYPVDIDGIMYIEWVDKYSCICTADNVYTSPQTLSQLEEQLSGKGFVRVSKPMLVNIRKVKWVSSVLNMKLTAELVNGERVAVSRHYRNDLLNAIFRMDKEAGK